MLLLVWDLLAPAMEPVEEHCTSASITPRKVSGAMRHVPRWHGASLTPLPQPAEQPAAASAWRPLGHALFRMLWIATVVSNAGTWMHNVGAAWLMTSLTASPAMIALVQAATSLPVFLVGLLAGALADIVDRRLLLLWTQGWMLASAAVLGILTLVGVTTLGSAHL